MRNIVEYFVLNRKEDVSGISGTGIVAEGIKFSDGKVILNWLTQYKSIGIYDSFHMMEKIHCHDGKTEVSHRARFFKPEKL